MHFDNPGMTKKVKIYVFDNWKHLNSESLSIGYFKMTNNQLKIVFVADVAPHT